MTAHPFAIAVAEEFDEASADEIAILFWTDVGLAFAQDLNPSSADQIDLYVGADTITLTETGADTRLFTATDPTHGACSADLIEFTGLDPASADAARADVSVGDIASGAVLGNQGEIRDRR